MVWGKLQIFERVTFIGLAIESILYSPSHPISAVWLSKLLLASKRRVITSPNARNAYRPMCWQSLHNRTGHRKSIRGRRNIIRRCLWDAQRNEAGTYHLSNTRRPPAVVDKKIIKQKKLITGSCLSSFFRLPNSPDHWVCWNLFISNYVLEILPLTQRQRLMSFRSIDPLWFRGEMQNSLAPTRNNIFYLRCRVKNLWAR